MNSIKITINIDSQGFKQKPIDEKDLNYITGRIRAKAPMEVTLEQLCKYIGQGHTFISGCVIDTTIKKLSANNTQNYAFFGLDIDNKGFQVTPTQMIDEVKAKLGADVEPTIYYETFTSTSDHKRFRLLYFFEKPIATHQEFKAMYNRLKILFPNCIDQATSNANRLWFGTNKPHTVRINPNFKPLGEDFFKRLEEVIPLDKKGGIARKDAISYAKCDLEQIDDVYKYVWFKNDDESIYELAEYIKDNVPIESYVEMMGADLTDHGDYYNCACPFHQGDNPTAFVIYKASNSAFCFSQQCVAGDVINLCKVFENKTYFEAIKTLLNRFELDVPKHLINLDKTYKGVY